MDANKIYLGQVRKGYEGYGIAECNLILYKHNLEPGGCWKFGILNNNGGRSGCIPNFETLFVGNTIPASQIFYEPPCTDSAWVVICETMKAAYCLYRAIKAYAYPVVTAGLVESVASPFMVQRLNADLERLLDDLWEYMYKDSKTTRLKEAIDLQERVVKDLKSRLTDEYERFNNLSEEWNKAGVKLKDLRADLACTNSPPKA